jgi:hypothetical protein
VVVLPHLAGHSQVSDSQVSLGIQHKVLRLEVPVDNFVLMEVFQPNDNIGNKELGFNL